MNIFIEIIKKIYSPVLIYEKAIQLEGQVDALNNGVLGGLPAYVSIFPHAYAIPRIKKNHRLMLYISPVLMLINIFLVPVISLFNVLIFRVVDNGIQKSKHDNLYLNTSNSDNLTLCVNEVGFPACAATRLYKNRLIDNRLNFSIIKPEISDRLLAFLFTCVLVFHGLIHSNLRLLLSMYSAPEWFSIYFLVRRLNPKHFWFSNHYDRWAYIHFAIPNAVVCLVQHGSLEIENGSKTVFFSKSDKITGINIIYALNEKSKLYFNEYIDTSRTLFKIINSEKIIVDWRLFDNRNFIKILIIGHHQYISEHICLISMLLSYFENIDICYRLHPMQKDLLSSKFTQLWINDSSCPIPRFDVCISYKSSILNELKESNIGDIIIADYNLESSGYSIINEQVCNRIKSIFN